MEVPTPTMSVVTDRLPDTVNSSVSGSTNSGLDLNKKQPVVEASSQPAATAKAYPQVVYFKTIEEDKQI